MSDNFLIKKTKIKVVGIGGGGGSVVSELAKKMKRTSFIVANTDTQALKKTPKNVRTFQFGEDLTGGLGTGMDVKLGELAAQNEKQRIKRLLKNQDFCIFVACLGGGTGSGATPIFAEIAEEFKGITLGIFTIPFKFEGERKIRIARESLEKIKPKLNGYLVIQNQRIFRIIDKKTSLDDSFQALNKILAGNLENLIELIYKPGLINIDFSDFKTILEEKGEKIYFNTVETKGQNRAEEAIKEVFNSSIIDFNNRAGKRILFNISGSSNLKMGEVEKICSAFFNLNPKSKIVFGISKNPPSQKSKIKVTLLVVGEDKKKKEVKPKAIIEKKEEKPKKPVEKKLEKKEKPEKEKKVPKKKKKRRKKRLSALEIKKAVQKEEEERLAEEEKWDVPAFLRRSPWKEKNINNEK